MSCDDVDLALYERMTGPRGPLPIGLVEHCTRCARCRELFELVEARIVGMPPLDPGLRERIEGAIMSSLRAVKPLAPAGTFVAGFLAVFLALAAGGVAMAGTGGTRAMSFWQFAGVTSVLSAGAVLIAVSLSRQMRPGSYQGVPPRILLFSVPAAFVLALGLWFPWVSGGRFLQAGLRCAGAALVLVAPAAVCFWLLVRRGVILSPGLAGATVGLLAGLVGATALHFGCEIAAAPHLAVWHAGIPVFSALAGFLLGRLASRAGGRNQLP